MCAIRQMDDENQSREASRIDARITFVTREFELGTVLHFFTFRSIGFFILFLLFFFFRNTQRQAYIYKPWESKKREILRSDLQVDNFVARALLGKPRRPTAFTPRHLRLVQGSRSLFSPVPVRCTCNRKEHGNVIAVSAPCTCNTSLSLSLSLSLVSFLFLLLTRNI